jgi:quercetin dioxygenase-like cupin family protein
MSVKHAKDVPKQVVKAGDRASMQVLISAQEGPHFAMRRFIMEPGGGMPNHTNTLEHEQYVLQGHATIGIGEQEFEVFAGDIVFIPEGVPHWYLNIGEEDFEFLCIIPNKEDRVTLLDKASC